MVRPTRITVNAGDNSWEAQLNSNLQQLYDRPLPMLLHADTLANLETVRPAAQFQWCMAIVDYDGGTTPGSHLAFSNGTAWKLASNWEFMNRRTFRGITTTDAFADTDETIVVTGASNFVLTLPAVTDANEGRICRLKHNGTGTVTVTPTGGDTIDGAATKVTSTQFDAFEFISDGTGDWQIFGASGAGGGSFVSLSDTPADYTAAASKTVKVNSAGDGLEFVDVAAGQPGSPLKHMSRGHVAASADQTLTTSNATILLPTEHSVAGSAISWDAVNNEFVINEDGTYLIQWQMQTDDASAHNVVAFLEKDPLGIGSFVSIENSTAFQGFSIRNQLGMTVIIDLLATDLIRLRGRDLSSVLPVAREGTGVSIIKLDVSIAGGGDMEVFQQGLEAAETHALTASMAVVDLASPVINNAVDLYTFTAGTDVLTLNEAGLYMISYTMVVDETSGTLETAAKLQKDIGAGFVDITGSESSGSGADKFTHGNTVLIELAATDEIKLMAQYTTSAGNAVAGTMLRVVRLKRGSDAIDYSTTEQDTGRKWEDGKTIFRKVVKATGSIATGATNYAHGITSFDRVVTLVGKVKRDSTPASQYPTNYSQVGAELNTNVDTTNIILFLNAVWTGAGNTLSDPQFIIEYTK